MKITSKNTIDLIFTVYFIYLQPQNNVAVINKHTIFWKTGEVSE